MTEGKAQVAIGLSIVALTKHLMGEFSISLEEAYKKLAGTELFKLLIELDTDLCLEPDAFLIEACMLELEKGADAMNDYVWRD